MYTPFTLLSELDAFFTQHYHLELTFPSLSRPFNHHHNNALLTITLGDCFRFGYGVSVDHDTAFKYYHMAGKH